MMMPPEAVSPLVAATAVAVARGARNVREVQEACQIPSTETVWHALREAREAGLVAFEDRLANTLHTTLRVVAASPRRPR